MVGWASSKVGEKKLNSNILRLKIIDTGFIWPHNHSPKLYSTSGVRSTRVRSYTQLRSTRPVGSTHHRENVIYISDKSSPLAT